MLDGSGKMSKGPNSRSHAICIMPAPGYRSISLPESLLKQAEELLEKLENEGLGSGYKTISEFVKDAVRRRVEALREIYFLGEKHSRAGK